MKTNRYSIIIFLLVVLLLSGCVEKQEEKIYRVGILCGLDYMADTADGFKSEMTGLGYIEGKNIVYDLQKTDFDIAEYQNILKKFVDDEVDLIFSFPTQAALEAKAATQGTNIPVLFSISNIEETGLIESIRQPGGHITGVRFPGPDLAIKRFELMCELVPGAKRIWVPYHRDSPIVKSQLEILRTAALAAGVTLIEAPVYNATEIQADLEARAKADDAGIDAILALTEPIFVTPDAFKVMCTFAVEHNVPIGGAIMSVEGCESIFGVYIKNFNTGEQAAKQADIILRGIPAGTIPVQSSESYFQFNYKAAQKFGLEVPEGLLAMADEIIR